MITFAFVLLDFNGEPFCGHVIERRQGGETQSNASDIWVEGAEGHGYAYKDVPENGIRLATDKEREHGRIGRQPCAGTHCWFLRYDLVEEAKQLNSWATRTRVYAPLLSSPAIIETSLYWRHGFAVEIGAYKGEPVTWVYLVGSSDTRMPPTGARSTCTTFN